MSSQYFSPICCLVSTPILRFMMLTSRYELVVVEDGGYWGSLLHVLKVFGEENLTREDSYYKCFISKNFRQTYNEFFKSIVDISQQMTPQLTLWSSRRATKAVDV